MKSLPRSVAMRNVLALALLLAIPPGAGAPRMFTVPAGEPSLTGKQLTRPWGSYPTPVRLEERELIPLAERHFSPQDWEIVDEGFSSNTDPIAQVKEKDFRELFSRLVNIAPAPVGLGTPWKKA